VADATFWGRGYGLLVFRSPKYRRNLWWLEIDTEDKDCYRLGRHYLEENHILLSAVVIDGKPGISEVFVDIPVQICHFHQIAIIRRYLTKRTKLPAARELIELSETLPKTNEETFTSELSKWQAKWEPLLEEKTFNPETGKSCYTHKRLRAAYRSLKRHLPYLFTYQRYPELGIPNTTNSIDGTFSYLKHLLSVHRGISKELRYKMISHILTHKTPTQNGL